MAHEIGALRAVRGGLNNQQVGQALDYAMTLVAGWPDKERAGITEMLEELRPLAEHNANIYAEAQAALRELSATQAKISRQQADLEKTRDETTALQERVAGEVAAGQAKLRTDQEAFVAEHQSKTEAMDGRAANLDEREADLETQRAEVAKRTDEVQAREKAVDEAVALITTCEEEVTKQIRKLREALA